MAIHNAKIIERGNGLAGAGEYVAIYGGLYRIVETGGNIQTNGMRGNYVYGTIEDAAWGDIAEDYFLRCIAEII